MVFYDTSSLLNLSNFNDKYIYHIAYITLKELEDIKISRTKDEQIKYQARQVTNYIANNFNQFHVHFAPRFLSAKLTNDEIILETAEAAALSNKESVTFHTADISLYNLAKARGKLKVQFDYDFKVDNYTGFKQINIISNKNFDDLGKIYISPEQNIWNLNTNEYGIFYDSNHKIIDVMKWNGTKYIPLKYHQIESSIFGVCKPRDIYQKLALDSFLTNDLTLLSGPPGSGKSQLALEYMCYMLEKGIINRIYMFCNPVAILHAAKLGFYKGDKNTKLLDSQIGNILNSKLGDFSIVNTWLDQQKLMLIPFSDLRGFDTGKNNGIYITEAQNLDITLLKLAIQRIGENCPTIVEGDYKKQTDSSCYDGINNGMRRLSEVFRGESFYGQIELQKIYRSQMAEVAERM